MDNKCLFKSSISELKEQNIVEMANDYIGMKDAANFLKISLSTMQKISANRLIPVYKPTKGKVYFLRKDLLEYLSAGRLRSRNEIEAAIKDKGGIYV